MQAFNGLYGTLMLNVINAKYLIMNCEKCLEKYQIMMYNISCRRNPIRQDFLTVYSPAVMPTFTYTGSNAESMKGGVLMKSKHIANGKKVAVCNFRDYHTFDNLFHKSRVTAIAVAITLN